MLYLVFLSKKIPKHRMIRTAYRTMQWCYNVIRNTQVLWYSNHVPEVIMQSHPLLVNIYLACWVLKCHSNVISLLEMCINFHFVDLYILFFIYHKTCHCIVFRKLFFCKVTTKYIVNHWWPYSCHGCELNCFIPSQHQANTLQHFKKPEHYGSLSFSLCLLVDFRASASYIRPHTPDHCPLHIVAETLCVADTALSVMMERAHVTWSHISAMSAL